MPRATPPQSGQGRTPIDTAYQSFGTGVSQGSVQYISQIPPTAGHTYVLRSIHYDAGSSQNVLIAFTLVRQDAADSSWILQWRNLATYPSPSIDPVPAGHPSTPVAAETLAASAISEAARTSLLASIQQVLAQSLALGQNLLVPASEDVNQYPTYATNSNTATTGMIRLIPSNPNLLQIASLDGFGYGFGAHSHTPNYVVDLSYNDQSWTVAPAGADYGFLINLGGVPIDALPNTSPALAFAKNYTPPSGQTRSVSDAEYGKFSTGVDSGGGTQAVSSLNPQVGDSYLLRAIHFDSIGSPNAVAYAGSNVLVAIQVVRQDPIDQSYILIWNILQTYPTPTESN